MALYEYVCESCAKGKPFRFELRMPMRDVTQFAPCPRCGKQAKKSLGTFAVVGVADRGLGPTPWLSEDGDHGDDPMAGHDHGHDHGHSHGPGGLDLDDDF